MPQLPNMCMAGGWSHMTPAVSSRKKAVEKGHYQQSTQAVADTIPSVHLTPANALAKIVRLPDSLVQKERTLGTTGIACSDAGRWGSVVVASHASLEGNGVTMSLLSAAIASRRASAASIRAQSFFGNLFSGHLLLPFGSSLSILPSPKSHVHSIDQQGLP